VGTVQSMVGTMQNYQQWGPCTATACPGDGGPAQAAQLYNPRALAFSPDGKSIYIADALNERIRKVDLTTGNISTFAGTGAADSAGNPMNGVQTKPYPSGVNGDGGDANSALFNQPHGVAVDSHGNVYVSDSNNQKIREIDAVTHKISTIAGTGNPQSPPCPLGVSVCNANVAGLKFPKSLFMAPGDKLYVADSGNNMVRMIDLSLPTPTITTIAGTTQSNHYNGDKKATQSQLWGPEGVAVDAAGNVFIADSNNNLVREVQASTGNLVTLAGDQALALAHQADPSTAPPPDSDSSGDGGPAVNAHLDGPRGVAVDSLGNVYIGQESGSNTATDTTGSRIRRIDPSGVITTVAGDGRTPGRGPVPGDPGPTASGQVEFNTMHDLAIDPSGNLWIADSKNNLVRVLWHPAQTGAQTITTPPTQPGSTCTSNCTPVPAGQSGYWMLGNDGKVYGFGDAKNLMFGDASTRLPAGAKAVHIEPTPDVQGYWINDDRGGVYAFGDANSSLGGIDPSSLQAGEKVTSLSSTPSGQGYWIFTSKGRVFTKGDAHNFGDLSAYTLNGPILDSIPTPSGQGYYMVGSDGGVFAFGDASFMGSMGNTKLNKPVEALVPTRDGTGYWLVASDGGIFAFGNAPFNGSLGGTPLNKPVVGMVRYGDGYLMVAADGGIFDFSSKPFQGSLGANPPAHPIVFAATLDS